MSIRSILMLAALLAGAAGLRAEMPADVPPADSASLRATVAAEQATAHAPAVRDSSVPGVFDWILNLPSDWSRWGVQTFRSANLGPFFVITTATAMTVMTDHETYDVLRQPYVDHPRFKSVSDQLTFIGDGKFQFGIAILFAGYGLGLGDSRALRTASQITEVILACGGVVQFLKHVTGRESPFVATRPTGRWKFFPNQVEYATHVPHFDAFPSGHLATALATLTVIQENYPEERWIPWVGYPVLGGLVTGLVASGIHWWSDFPLSIALGYGFAQIVAHPDRPADGHADVWTPHPALTTFSDGTVGLGVQWSW